MSTLTLFLPDALEAPWVWQVDDGRSGVAESPEQKNALAALGASRVDAVMAGQSVRSFPHDLPKLRDSERLSAAGFAIEDKIAGSLKEQHIVIATGEDKRIFVSTKKAVENLLSAVSETGLKAEALYADFDVLPRREDPYVLDDRVIYADDFGYTLDRDWAEGGENQPVAGLLPLIDKERGVNLLAGDYGVRSQLNMNWTALRNIAAMTGFAALTGLGFLWSEGRAMQAQADALKAQTRTLYTERTGEAAPTNVALAVTRAVKSGGGTQTDFLTFSGLLFDSLKDVDGVSIDMMQYDAKQNQLNVRLIYPEFETAGLVERAISERGASFQAGGVREQNGQLLGAGTIRLGTR